MSLLTELMDRPLDPSYAAAARARRSRGVPDPRRGWNSLAVGVIAAVTGLLFTTSAVVLGRAESPRAQGRADLIARIEDRQRVVDRESERIAVLGEEIRDLEAGALETTRGTGVTRSEGLRFAAGSTALTGPGIRITLDDAAALGEAGGGGPREGTDEETGRIVYRDLQNVTNDLWAAGAEAIAVNGHRLTSTSAIRFAGRAILVGFRPLARPYVVEAVMGPESRSAYRDGPGGAYLADLRTAYSARAEAVDVEALSLPAAETVALRHARPVGGLPASSRPGPGVDAPRPGQGRGDTDDSSAPDRAAPPTPSSHLAKENG